jgi:hypothetical protein
MVSPISRIHGYNTTEAVIASVFSVWISTTNALILMRRFKNWALIAELFGRSLRP